MTSWSEEFLGVSFTPRTRVPRPMNVNLENLDMNPDADRESLSVLRQRSHGNPFPGLPNDSTMVLERLEQLPAAVAVAATAALQPHLAALQIPPAREAEVVVSLDDNPFPLGDGQQRATSSASMDVLSMWSADASAAASMVAQELIPQLAATLTQSINEAFYPEVHDLLRQGMAQRIRSHAEKDPQVATNLHGTSVNFPTPREQEDAPSAKLCNRKIRRMQTSSQSQLPRKAFVVNFRRLIAMQKTLKLIHEIVAATAIAALTLVGAGNRYQLLFSVLFVGLIFVLFSMHETKYDTTDISDFKQLVELLADDNGVRGTSHVENPNRLLKALTRVRGGARRRTRTLLTTATMLLSMVGLWSYLCTIWNAGPEEIEGVGFILFGEAGSEDQAKRATLLLVGTLLAVFGIVFEVIYWRETQCIMPRISSKTSESWDPKHNGVPTRYRWFGLPSMWFTTYEAYDDVRVWITFVSTRKGNVFAKIFPEEMALYALDAPSACFLSKTLMEAKLFDVQRSEFLTRRDNGAEVHTLELGEEPEELGISLVFYDNLRNEYLQVNDDYSTGVMHSLQLKNWMATSTRTWYSDMPTSTSRATKP